MGATALALPRCFRCLAPDPVRLYSWEALSFCSNSISDHRESHQPGSYRLSSRHINSSSSQDTSGSPVETLRLSQTNSHIEDVATTAGLALPRPQSLLPIWCANTLAWSKFTKSSRPPTRTSIVPPPRCGIGAFGRQSFSSLSCSLTCVLDNFFRKWVKERHCPLRTVALREASLKGWCL